MRLLKCAFICLGITALLASAYVVKEGDTLWDLSDEFLKDPFAWPDLWENTRHIQDPHWIYPGDSIYLGDSIREETVLTTEKSKYPCNAAISDSALPKGKGYSVTNAGCDNGDERNSDFEDMLGNLRDKDKKSIKKPKPVDEYYYQKRPAPKIFNGYYQLHAPEIYTLDSIKNDKRFFSIRSGEKKEPIIHLPESEVVIGIGKKTDSILKRGDLVEIIDAKYELLEGNYVAEAIDLTDKLGTDELVNYQNRFAAFKGMTVEKVEYKNGEPGDDIYVTLDKDGKSYSFCVEIYLTGKDSEVYTTVGALKAGDVVDVEGFVYWYEGINTHITAINVAE